MENVIEVDSLIHRFGERTALDNLSYSVKAGEVFALLGPNGAGKTTTIRLLNGLYTPSSGDIQVLGKNPVKNGVEIRQQTGVLTETNALYERLSARQNLVFFGTLYGLSSSELQNRVEEMLKFFSLQNRADDRVSTYSKGMKQRLALARAMLNHPKILFLDEPTSSLDPESAQQVHEMIQSIRERDGHTVFLCTHHLDEAEKLADRVAILNAGHLLALGSLPELRKKYDPGISVDIELWQPLTSDLNLQKVSGVKNIEQKEKHLRIQVQDESVIPQVANEIVRQNGQLLSLTPTRFSLEEIYFQLQESARQEIQ